MEYTIERLPKGKRLVAYNCPNCREHLKSKLEEAGNKDKCPICGHQFVVPGEDELLAFHQEQEAQRQKQEQERLAGIQRAAAAKLAADIQSQARERERFEQRAKAQAERERQLKALGKSKASDVADRFLGWAFSFGKLVSVVVLAVCFAAIAYNVVQLMSVTEAPPRTPAPKAIAPPSVAEYRPLVQPPAPSSANSTAGTSAGGGSATSAEPQEDPLDRRLKVVVRQAHMPEMDYYEISSVMIRCGYENWEKFVAGLEQLAAACRASNLPFDGRAVRWYAEQFQSRARAAEDAQKARESERAIAQAEAASRRSYLLTVIGGAVGALLAFLFLPLLIQIEQNTRKLFEHEAMNLHPSSSGDRMAGAHATVTGVEA